jgi:hypothetical protein
MSDNTAANNRLLMPETAKLVDQLREVFGADIRVIYAREGAVERGSPLVGVGVVPTASVTINQALPPLQIETVKRSSVKQKAQQKKIDSLKAMVNAGQIKLGAN